MICLSYSIVGFLQTIMNTESVLQVLKGCGLLEKCIPELPWIDWINPVTRPKFELCTSWIQVGLQSVTTTPTCLVKVARMNFGGDCYRNKPRGSYVVSRRSSDPQFCCYSKHLELHGGLYRILLRNPVSSTAQNEVVLTSRCSDSAARSWGRITGDVPCHFQLTIIYCRSKLRAEPRLGFRCGWCFGKATTYGTDWEINYVCPFTVTPRCSNRILTTTHTHFCHLRLVIGRSESVGWGGGGHTNVIP
jgi:hypothetical protein